MFGRPKIAGVGERLRQFIYGIPNLCYRFPLDKCAPPCRGRRDKEVNNAIEALSTEAVTERNFFI